MIARSVLGAHTLLVGALTPSVRQSTPAPVTRKEGRGGVRDPNQSLWHSQGDWHLSSSLGLAELQWEKQREVSSGPTPGSSVVLPIRARLEASGIPSPLARGVSSVVPGSDASPQVFGAASFPGSPRGQTCG